MHKIILEASVEKTRGTKFPRNWCQLLVRCLLNFNCIQESWRKLI